MRTSISSLFALAALAAATTLAMADTPLYTAASVTANNGNNVLLTPVSGVTNLTDGGAASTSYTGDIWLRFTALKGGNGVANIKLQDDGTSNSSFALRFGTISGDSTAARTNWSAQLGASGTAAGTAGAITAFTPTTVFAADTPSYILIKIDYNTGTATDVGTIWRFSSAFDLDNFNTSAAASWTATGALEFDAIQAYAAAGTTLTLSDIRIGTSFAAVPEPSTYALLFGAATLGFVGYRRFRKRQA